MLRSEQRIPVELLRRLISLDAATGDLTWKARTPDMFTPTLRRTAEHICNNWNSLYAGTPALSCVDASGHLTGRIFDKLVYAHRVVFALTHGSWPENSVDHINGVPSDNRPINLRDVCHQENLRNQRHRVNSSSGVTGVSMNKRLGKWAAHIGVSGKFVHLGFHERKDDAISARKQAEAQYGFHPNHGRTSP